MSSRRSSTEERSVNVVCTRRYPDVTKSPTRTRATPSGNPRVAEISATDGRSVHIRQIRPRTSPEGQWWANAERNVSMGASSGNSTVVSVRPDVSA